jgi:putative DNA primase/helicase
LHLIKNVELNYDTEIWVSKVKSADSSTALSQNILWSEFVSDCLMEPIYTQDKGSAGAIIGGNVEGEKRRSENIIERWMTVLDIDRIPTGLTFKGMCSKVESLGVAAFLNTTHSSLKNKLKVRLWIPHTEGLNIEAYPALARKLAEKIGLDFVDPCSYKIAQLMFLPTIPQGQEYLKKVFDLPILDAKKFLNEEYLFGWEDVDSWPKSISEIDSELKIGKSKKQDPYEMDGIPGVFNRTYTDLRYAIEKFLSDKYEMTSDTRGTWKEGTNKNGLWIIDDKYIKSFHSTDPANNGHIHSIFHLIKLHLYPDDGTKAGEKLAYDKMCEFVANDSEVSKRLIAEHDTQIKEEFTDGYDSEWKSKLERDKKGNYKTTLENINSILKNDEKLQGFKYDIFSDRYILTGLLPGLGALNESKESKEWEDGYECFLYAYFEKYYGIKERPRIDEGFEMAMKHRAYHPVREYLNSLPEWDKMRPQVETVLINTFGIEDTPLFREQTKIVFTALIARIMEPGCKFDYMPVLISEGGFKKSSFFQFLTGDRWFTEIKGELNKAAQEKLQGAWIVEMSELEALKKSGIEQVKSFITDRFDRYRNAYGRYAKNHPRQCVFFGSTNEEECIQESGNGERRFWPFICTKQGNFEGIDIDRLWAEALHLYRSGQELYLSEELEAEAKRIRTRHFERPEGTDELAIWLDRPVDALEMPENNIFDYKAGEVREYINATVIWEDFYHRGGLMNRRDSLAINKMLSALGWIKVRYGNKRVRCYIRPVATTSDHVSQNQ